MSMPQMGYDMKEGTVVRWLVNEGAEVSLGDAIAEIETDKAVVEFESITSGVLRMILVPEGTTVSVGQPIAIIGDADEEITAPSSEGDPAGPEPIEEAPPAPESEESASILLPPPSAEVVEAASTLSPQGMRASPVARQLADERDLDLRLLRGTGPGGRITKNDVLSFEPAADQGPPEPAPVAEEIASTVPAAEPPPVAEEIAPTAPAVEHELEAEPPAAKPPPAQPVEAVSGDIVPLTRMRQQIARVTVRSKREIPHFYVSAQIDMSRAMDLRQQFNDTLKSEGVRVSVNDMIIKACADTLKGFPNLNSFFTDNGIQMNQSINIGVAIAEDAGLIVPAIMDCGNKGMADIARASSDLIDRAKSGTLHPQEYTGGTFSISNLGMFDVTSFVAIIQPPQSAMLAVGTVAEAPVVQDHEIKVSRVMNATISADHRVSDGAEAARFIVEVKRLLENPLSLLV